MTSAEAISRIVREPITAAELVAVNGDTLVFRCEPQQEIRLRITSRLLEVQSDRRNHTLWTGRHLYERETKCLLKAGEASRNEVLT